MANRDVTALRHRLEPFVWLALLTMFGVALGPTVSRLVVSTAATANVAPAKILGEAMHRPTALPAAGHEMDMGSRARHMAADGPAHPPYHPGDRGHGSCVLDCCALCAVAATPFTGAAVVVSLWLTLPTAAVPRPEEPAVTPGRHALWLGVEPRGPPLAA